MAFCSSRYDQASAQAEGMENQATRLSSEAKDESNMANNMLKDISNIERFIPSTLKVVAQNVYPS